VNVFTVKNGIRSKGNNHPANVNRLAASGRWIRHAGIKLSNNPNNKTIGVEKNEISEHTRATDVADTGSLNCHGAINC
jgi:hypothetical protein